jgi:hypothetical protein
LLQFLKQNRLGFVSLDPPSEELVLLLFPSVLLLSGVVLLGAMVVFFVSFKLGLVLLVPEFVSSVLLGAMVVFLVSFKLGLVSLVPEFVSFVLLGLVLFFDPESDLRGSLSPVLQRALYFELQVCPLEQLEQPFPYL